MDESVIRTAELVVSALTFFDRLYVRAHRSGGFFDVGSADSDIQYKPKRDILWESTVYLLGEPNPVLIIDASGKIIAKTYNVTVRASEFGPALNIGDTIAGGTIWIDPIIYDELPAALFEANAAGSGCDDDCNGLIHGGQGIFYLQQTWNSVLIRNSSEKSIVLKGTTDPQSVSINTLNSHLTSTPLAAISVSVDNGPHAPPATQWFWHVHHIFPSTDVVIESLRPTAATGFNLTIDGDIRNTIGNTHLTNQRGSILRGTDGGTETFYSNTITLDSELGSLGTVPNPLTLVLVQIFHTGEVGVPAVLKPVAPQRRSRPGPLPGPHGPPPRLAHRQHRRHQPRHRPHQGRARRRRDPAGQRGRHHRPRHRRHQRGHLRAEQQAGPVRLRQHDRVRPHHLLLPPGRSGMHRRRRRPRDRGRRSGGRGLRHRPHRHQRELHLHRYQGRPQHRRLPPVPGLGHHHQGLHRRRRPVDRRRDRRAARRD